MCTPHSSWLTSLTFWPSPGSGPTTGALRASASRSGRAPLDRRLGAADHDQQVALARPRDAAGHGRVDHVARQPPRPDARTGAGPTVAIKHERRLRRERVRELFSGRCPNCSGVATITASRSTPVAASTALSAASTPSSLAHALGVDVEGDRLVSGAGDTRGDGAAHRAEADPADSGHV